MRRRLLAGVVASALLLTGYGLGRASVPQDLRLTEDDPAWNCATMGNRVCGPLVPRAEQYPQERP